MPRVAKKSVDIGREMEYMLATGNLRSRSGLGLQQVHQVGTKRQWTAPIHFQLRDMLCSILPESVCKVRISSGRIRGSRLWPRSSTSTATCLTSEQCTEEPSSPR